MEGHGFCLENSEGRLMIVDFTFTCPHCGKPFMEPEPDKGPRDVMAMTDAERLLNQVVQADIDIHSGAEVQCRSCGEPVVLEAFTPEQYVKVCSREAEAASKVLEKQPAYVPAVHEKKSGALTHIARGTYRQYGEHAKSSHVVIHTLCGESGLLDGPLSATCEACWQKYKAMLHEDQLVSGNPA